MCEHVIAAHHLEEVSERLSQFYSGQEFVPDDEEVDGFTFGDLRAALQALSLVRAGLKETKSRGFCIHDAPAGDRRVREETPTVRTHKGERRERSAR